MVRSKDASGCTATTKTGAACRAQARPGRRFCFAHDPKLAERRKDGRSRGGLTRTAALREADPLAERPSLRTPEQVLDALEGVLANLLAGRMSERRATAAGYLLQVALRAQDHSFEERLAAVEQAAGISTAGGGRDDIGAETRAHRGSDDGRERTAPA